MNKKSFSLIEVMISVAIVGLALMPLIMMNMRSNRVSVESKYRTIANKLINQKLEEFKFMDFVEFCKLFKIKIPVEASSDNKDFIYEGDFTGKNPLTDNEFPEEYTRYRWKITATPHIEYERITSADLKVNVIWNIITNGSSKEYSVERMTLKVNPGFVRLPDKNK